MFLRSIGVVLGVLACGVVQASERVRIYWDNHNVPYIQATSDPAVLWGQGWALAECNYPVLRLHHAKSMGYSAKYLGGGSFYVENDFYVKQLEIPEISQGIYAAMPANVKALVDAFDKGLNDYYLAHKAALDAAYPQFQSLLALPVTGADTIAAELSLYIKLFGIGGLGTIHGLTTMEDLFSTTHSNEWVVRSDRTVSEHPMLQVDPHIALQYEESLFTFLCGLFSDNLQMVGFNQLGAPLIRVGAKLKRAGVAGDHSIAWTLTAGPLDEGDVFKVQEDATQASYLFNGLWIPFTVKNKTVTMPDGSILTRSYKYTVHGLVLEESSGFAYALKHVLTSSSDINRQFLAMLTATDINAFYTALGQLAWPGGNLVLASDTTSFADQIRYLLYGPCPVRNPAIDWTQVVDGSTSATLWSAFHAVSELPQVTGTSQDHFINDNCGIYHTWSGFTAQSFPAYMILDGTLTTFRQERAEALLTTGQVDLDAMIAVVRDKVDGPSLYAVPLLAQAFQTYGTDPSVNDPTGVLDDLIAVLTAWNHVASVDSQIEPLFAYWLALFSSQYPTMFGRPNFVPAQFSHQEAVDALNALVVAFNIDQFKGLPEWGDVHWFKRVVLQGGTPTEIHLPTGGVAESLRSAYGAMDVDCTDGSCYEFEVTNGQTCPILIELGPDAASTKMRCIKAMDNCNDYHLPAFGTVESTDWASESYHALATTVAQAQQAAVRSETLTYTP